MQLVSTAAFHRLQRADLPWLVDPFALRGSTWLLYGRQGIGKSSLAWQLAHALSTGTPWLGHPVLAKGKVVYLNFDMPALEFQRLLNRAADAGMSPTDNILMPELGDTDYFDVLSQQGGELIQACKPITPIATVVDTVYDSYLPGQRTRDVNAEVRLVVGRFRQVVPHGLLVLMMHDRKKSAFQGAEANADDPDAFSGPGAWEQKVTASFRMVRTAEKGLRLLLRKTRLEKVPYDQIPLEVTEDGFFTTKTSIAQELHTWRGPFEHLKEVFEAIARNLKEDPETVRKAYNRAIKRGVRFAWDTRRTDKMPSDTVLACPTGTPCAT